MFAAETAVGVARSDLCGGKFVLVTSGVAEHVAPSLAFPYGKPVAPGDLLCDQAEVVDGSGCLIQLQSLNWDGAARCCLRV